MGAVFLKTMFDVKLSLHSFGVEVRIIRVTCFRVESKAEVRVVFQTFWSRVKSSGVGVGWLGLEPENFSDSTILILNYLKYYNQKVNAYNHYFKFKNPKKLHNF